MQGADIHPVEHQGTAEGVVGVRVRHGLKHPMVAGPGDRWRPHRRLQIVVHDGGVAVHGTRGPQPPPHATRSRMAACPTTAPPGRPPAMILANVVMSGVTPVSCWTPPGALRNPVMTSSKIRTTWWRRVRSRNPRRYSASVGMVPLLPPPGSRITAATS